jgi:hypothetical protein
MKFSGVLCSPNDFETDFRIQIMSSLLLRNLFLSLLLVPVCVQGQAQSSQSFELNWDEVQIEKLDEQNSVSFLSFEGASYPNSHNHLPHLSVRFELPSGTVEVRLSVEVDQVLEFSRDELELIRKADVPIQDQATFNLRIEEIQNKTYAYVDVLPILRSSVNSFKKVKSLSLSIEPVRSSVGKRGNARGFTSSSVLASGNWYKMAVWEDAIYKIDYHYLRSLGWDLKNISSSSISIYGNAFGELPVENFAYRPDDLAENAIYISDGGDNKMDEGDYILFYAKGPHRWRLTGNEYDHQRNVFTDSSYYFITHDAPTNASKRIPSRNSLSAQDVQAGSYDYLAIHERESKNLIKSGRLWFGESFDIDQSQTIEFEVPNISTTEDAKLRAQIALRTVQSTSTMELSVRGITSTDMDDNGGVSGVYYETYARLANRELTFKPIGDVIVDMEFSKGNADANAWLDFLELHARRLLVMNGDQMDFRDSQLPIGVNAGYRISNISTGMRIWDVTDPWNVVEQNYVTDNGTAVFGVSQDTLKEFISFYNRNFPEPRLIGQIENQNLHSLVNEFPDLIIVTPPILESSALDLASFRVEHDGLDVLVAITDQIYNEFSGGAQDITAIKDFVRMFYEAAAGDPERTPRYLLLFGDASYDYKDRYSGNTNLIPTYESGQSLEVTTSYASDDYFALLGLTDSDRPSQLIKIGVGRLPIRNTTEAQNAVRKLKRYQSTSSLGAWRNRIAFVGDDEDGKIHMRDADSLSLILDATYKQFNIERIYFDAFKQESTPGGERYPGVNNAINEAMRKGMLTISYVGHGGELGWAHERVLEIADINKWSNANEMPLYVTATCEFARFDDPNRTSAGEFVFLNPDGAGIGLLTTTRLVYSTPNFRLGKAFNRVAYEPLTGGERPRVGDLVLQTKTTPGNQSINSRVFALLGDPSMKLAYPKYKVVTTQAPDTMQALDKVTLSGYIEDLNGNKMTGFNGTIFPLVFDKKKTIQTLNNDGVGPFTYRDRSSVIFRGKAKVKDGEFSFSFVVPKDISKIYGGGKISYYAHNGEEDANGFHDNFIIGGQNANAPQDDEGPQISLFMNDENFVRGGITNESPDLYATFFDDNGINTAGNGVGHDIVATLDKNTADAIVLNDYYESEEDSYQSGKVRYPLSELKPGTHTLHLKAWDTHNNSGESETEFLVTQSANLALYHVLNYPNPFTTNTDFFFEHNLPDEELQVRVQIFTISGRSVKTIDGFYTSQGFRIGPINWDGRDEYGDPLAKGAYVYRVKVIAPSGEVAEKFEKLVILN